MRHRKMVSFHTSPI